MSTRASKISSALLAAIALLAPARAGAQDEIGQAMRQASELASAGELEAAIAVLQEADGPETTALYRALLQVRIGEFQRVLGRWGLALETLDFAAAALGERSDTCQLRCYLLAVRAQVRLDQGLLDVASRDAWRARELLVEAEGAGTSVPLDSERTQVDYVQATILTSREDYLELDAFVAGALEHDVYSRYPEKGALLLARLGLGLKEAARLDPRLTERARTTLERALAAQGLPPLERVLPELGLGELALRARNWNAAQQWIERATAHLGPQAGHERLPQHASWLALTARLAFERDDRPASREERERLRAALARAADRSLEEWSRRELRPGGYGFLQYTDQRSLLSEWIRLELTLTGEPEGVEAALERVVRAGDASTLARRLGAGGTDLARARAELLGPPEEHALLVYFPAPDRSHLFVVDRERATHVSLESSDVLQQARLDVARALESVQRPEPGAAALLVWHAALARMAELLLPQPARVALGERSRVTIVGRDLLGDLPFEALPLAPGEWLGCSLALSSLPSLAVGRALAARAAREMPLRAIALEDAVLLVAAPSASRLSLSREEAQSMLAAYPERARRLAFGADATETSLRTASAARVLEIFTHGRRDPARERPMTLLLDLPDGAGAVLLGADEVETLDAPPLVVLSVCRSGQGPKRRGDASAGELASAFFLAGERARCVIASAFDLDAEATRHLSRAFHAGLVAGLAPDEAMRSARAELAGDETFADPRFHGLLGVLGAARVPLYGP